MTSILSRLIDLLAPRLCLACGQRLTPSEHTLCATCNLHLPRTGFQAIPTDNEMARMFWGRIPVERCGALFFYRAGSQPSHLIYHLKYNDHPEAGIDLGRMVAREYAAAGFFDGIQLIVPVPLAPTRQHQRGYNQSRQIALGISEVTGIKVAADVVRRKTFNTSQTHQQRWDRTANVEDVFRLLRPEKVTGRHILLVDDVSTTGATLCACAQALAGAGEVSVSILTLGFAKP